MGGVGGLARRTVLASAGAALLGRTCPALGQTRPIKLGTTAFKVPEAYLFSQGAPPGMPGGDLPPRFSFAFTMPDGAPAGAGLEFPPMTHPFVLDRGGGRYLVMCADATSSQSSAVNTPPRQQLANNLTDTAMFNYSKVDGMLDIGWSKAAGIDQRYLGLISTRDRVGIEAFLTHNQDGAFYYGNAELERPAVTTVIYIPAARIAEAGSCLNKVAELLKSWEI